MRENAESLRVVFLTVSADMMHVPAVPQIQVVNTANSEKLADFGLPLLNCLLQITPGPWASPVGV